MLSVLIHLPDHRESVTLRRKATNFYRSRMLAICGVRVFYSNIYRRNIYTGTVRANTPPQKSAKSKHA